MPHASLVFDVRTDERRATLVEAAYTAIKEAIRNGVFPPGFQGSELEIAERLGMSRTPVHQAIIQLQGEGMVELRAKRGVIISALSPVDMREVYDVIIALEGMAAVLICERPEAERETICRQLEAENARIAEALSRDDLGQWADHDAAFHALLVEAAGNGRLERIAKVNIDQSYRARRLTLKLRSKPTQSVVEHQAIIDGLRNGDAAAACQAAQDHKIKARDLIVNVLERYDMRHL